uniref:(northern house mosquito) hypothetical protein n=1 Tax=Culex pipiens TaxID=7175 RepID=A0A8D8BHN6_CULPI
MGRKPGNTGNISAPAQVFSQNQNLPSAARGRKREEKSGSKDVGHLPTELAHVAPSQIPAWSPRDGDDGIESMGRRNTAYCLRSDGSHHLSGRGICASPCHRQNGPLHPHRTMAQQRAAAGTPREPAQDSDEVGRVLERCPIHPAAVRAEKGWPDNAATAAAEQQQQQ